MLAPSIQLTMGKSTGVLGSLAKHEHIMKPGRKSKLGFRVYLPSHGRSETFLGFLFGSLVKTEMFLALVIGA